MEKKNFNVKGNRTMAAFANVNVEANANSNFDKNINEAISDSTVNNYNIDLKAEVKDAEITGSDTFDIKMELPFGGKIEIKATSNVTSSVLAQRELNEQARENLQMFAKFLGEVAMGVAPAIKNIKETLREEKKKDAESRANLSSYYAKREHELLMDQIRYDHEKDTLRDELWNAKRYHENEDSLKEDSIDGYYDEYPKNDNED